MDDSDFYMDLNDRGDILAPVAPLTKPTGRMDNTARPRRGRKRRPAEVSVPSELAYAPVYTKQSRFYTDCYRWELTDEQRRQWVGTRSPVLGGLHVFSCGIFVEARGHWWERTNLPEGVLIYCTEGKGYYRQGDR